ncbi:MAG TPA: lactonase family protein [Terracidiphilus sp.]|jgi:6-phosphogluconolactonase
MSASAASLLAATTGLSQARTRRIFVASNTADGIRSFDWNPASGDLTPVGVAAKIDMVDWICFSPDRKYLFAACEVDSFNGKPTGELASFRVIDGKLEQLSGVNSANKGTCHCAIDHTGRVLISADYGGASAASFKVTNGKLSDLVWSEHYTVHGPNPQRQESAHAHFASFSPDNRFAYVNDLGGDMIHIYTFSTETAELKSAGAYHAAPGAGPRTLHFHPNGHTAYSMNEMASSVDILNWNKADGNFKRIHTIELLPPNAPLPDPKDAPEGNTGCDTVITKDGRYVYFANRGTDFLYSFKCEPATGALTPMERSSTGGKTPRNFTLDPEEHWMLVADQNSSNLAIFSRDLATGKLAHEGKKVDCPTPMCILFL